MASTLSTETVKRRRIVVVWVALLAHFAASNGNASCVATSELAVRARFVRCEDAKFYLEASDAYSIYEQALEEILAHTDPQFHEVVRERLGVDRDATSLLPPDYEARVAVVMVDWRASIAPWRPDISDTVEIITQPQEFYETVRYWWNGSNESCEDMLGGTAVDLWVHPPCCDTIPGMPVCLVSMSYAEPAPETISEALSRALSTRFEETPND